MSTHIAQKCFFLYPAAMWVALIGSTIDVALAMNKHKIVPNGMGRDLRSACNARYVSPITLCLSHQLTGTETRGKVERQA